ncbi:MAG: FlgD immunoglobulin-like domain containing protein [Spirochaetales bacterium]
MVHRVMVKRFVWWFLFIGMVGIGSMAYAGGSAERLPPRVIVDKEDMYLSPASSPGVKDTITIKISIEPDRQNKMVIKEFRLTIKDAQGKEVRVWQNRDERRPGFFARLFIALGFMKKPELEVPESITWDGKDSEGKFVPDGVYTYVLEAWDDGGNKAESELRKLVVDNTPPNAEISFDYTIFSPDNDGRRDTLPVRVRASSEDRWKAEVLDSTGKGVAIAEWEGTPPERFFWTGQDPAGKLLPDGSYTIKLSSEDRAGNTFALTTSPVTIDTRPRVFTLGVDYLYFSPNGDGAQDVVTLTPSGLIPDGLVEVVLELLDERGGVRRTEKGPPPLPTSVQFDGRDGAGNLLPDGKYRIRATASYENGAVVTAETPILVLDTKPAQIQITATTPIISPNFDGFKDDVTFTLKGGKEGYWKGIIADPAGNILFSYDHEGGIPETLYFNGMGLDGKPIPDGVYVVYIEGRDLAGNPGRSNRFSVEVDTRPTTLGVGTDLSAFSPNGDGIKDRITILPILHQGRETEAYQLQLKDASGRVIRTIAENRPVPAQIFWDGKDDAGKVVPDGKYTADLMVAYRNGNRPTTITSPFEVDTLPPEATVFVANREVRQDAAGKLTPLQVEQRSSDEEGWVGEFLVPGTNQVVFRKTWKGRVESFAWEGQSAAGSPVPSGEYVYRLTGEDRAGNRAVFEVKDLRVTWIQPAVSIVPQLAAFSPNGDGVKDTLSFDITTNVREGVTGWVLEVSKDKEVVASIQGKGPIPSTLQWDGKDPKGEKVPDGEYTVRFTLQVQDRSISSLAPIPIRVDTTPPIVSLELHPVPFSPDHDGKDDLFHLRIAVEDASTIEAWRFTVLDPKGQDIQSADGIGNPPAELSWDGYSRTGDLVQSATEYPLFFEIRDEVGNVAKGSVKILVDVLVFPEDGRNQIRVANIQFAPWTTDYLKWNEEIAKTNVASIDQVASMLKVFPNYRVRLEGHAVSVLYYDAAASEREHKLALIPLSQNRARVIKEALIERGIVADRIETEGFGGSKPLVPFSDLEKRWINRRVEFILLRK